MKKILLLSLLGLMFNSQAPINKTRQSNDNFTHGLSEKYENEKNHSKKAVLEILYKVLENSTAYDVDKIDHLADKITNKYPHDKAVNSKAKLLEKVEKALTNSTRTFISVTEHSAKQSAEKITDNLLKDATVKSLYKNIK